MTPERLRKILDALGWNATALARRLGMVREEVRDRMVERPAADSAARG